MQVPMLTMLLGHHYYGRVGIYRSCNSILASHHSVYFSTHCPSHGNLTGKRLNVRVAAEERMNVVPRAWCWWSLG